MFAIINNYDFNIKIMAKKKVVSGSDELTEIVCVLDRSGSMLKIISDMIGGFNAFIHDQKNEVGRCKITVVIFDDQYDLIFDNINLKDMIDMTYEIWKPRGMTALYDAIGKTINTVEERHAKSKEKPSKVLFVVVTDGLENKSKEFNKEDVKNLISNKEKDNWSFLYLAANQDAFAVGGDMGFKGGNTMNFSANAEGSVFVNSTLSNSAKYYRSVSSDVLFDAETKFSENIINNVTGDVNNPNKVIKTTKSGEYKPEGDISGGTIPTLNYTKKNND